MRRKLSIFISSTFVDLKEERDVIIKQVLRAGHIPIGLEKFTASNKTAISVIEDAIRESDVYVAIVGSRFGSLMQDSDNNGKSFMQFEYEYARKLHKPMMVFILGENEYKRDRAHIRSNDRERTYERQLREFREIIRLTDGNPKVIVNFFGDEFGGLQGLNATFQSGLQNLTRLLDVEKLPEHEFVAFALFDKEIKVVSLTPDGSYKFLDSEKNLHNIFYVSSETLVLQKAIEELEFLINYKTAKEKDFQDFFERNPDFILNDEYKKAHPHIVLTKDDGSSLIPDFVLEPINQNALSDVLELKLPSTQIFVLRSNRKRFSSAVFEASAQLREYQMFFDEEKNRQNIQRKYGLLAYKPKMFVIIGRKGNVNPIDVRKIETDLPNLYLRTYDDLIARMKFKVDAMKKGRFKD